MEKLNHFCAQDLSSNLTLNKLKELIEPFRDIKILIGITCRPEFYDYLVKEFQETKSTSLLPDYYGVQVYKINNQKQNIKYWYNNQVKELDKYLKENI